MLDDTLFDIMMCDIMTVGQYDYDYDSDSMAL